MAKKKKTPKKKAAKKKGSQKKAATSGKRKTASDNGGPVTLAEAEAMLEEKKSRRRRSPKKKKRASSVVTPQMVGVARKKLKKEQEKEDDRRIREYKALMTIMKKRGVKGLAEPEKSGKKKASAPKKSGPKRRAATGGQPLQIFAEGDSWFDYPVPFFKGGIIKRLKKRLGVPILSLAKAGDEVRNMLGVEERKKIQKHLAAGSPAGGSWDVMLFSGGGNDIVGNPMALWIRDFDSELSAADQIDKKRFAAAVTLVRAGYEDLIGLRDELSPNTHLVFHGYDFAIPDGRGICGMGPWLKPTFDLRKFPALPKAFQVVQEMLKQFADELRSLETKHDGITFIDTQGTLTKKPSSWHNELHPSKAGFDKVTKLFHKELKTLFPGRVL